MNSSILITAYYPPISYFTAILNSNDVYIELQENYERQTIRNRCYILSANGVQLLSVPVKKTEQKHISQIEIDYSTQWQNKHAHAIRSAYGKSPFFHYYYDELISPVFKKHRLLIELNNDILKTCLHILNISAKINYTTTFIKNYTNCNDYREKFNKKYPPYLINKFPIKPYIQAFYDRYKFIEDLSIMDLIFNTGFEALLYLNNRE